ncbi:MULTISPECIES: NADP-dependent oxidoreductase [unclassified Myroides]|uniref:NADP-dependent oxidoreductase n=1 Tax=unclassified Myroides TaxID=2642485 RepID=UPI003D2F5E39
MKAITLEGFGGVEHLHYKEIPIPQPKANEVLIRTKAISINPVDIKVRTRQAPLAEQLLQHHPLILGWDISGIIVQVGDTVSDFSVGDEVFGMVNFVGHGQTYAEYVAAPAHHVALKPKNISHAAAAASTLAALTAWQAFTSYGKLRPHDRLLIHAAAGGVGHFAVQITKYLGAYVIATSSSSNKDFVLSLGANEHLDYRKVDFEKKLSSLDFVLESIGGTNFQKSISVLKPFGTIVTLPSGHTKEDEQKAQAKFLHACYFMSVYSSQEDMKQIAQLLAAGHIKPHLSHIYSFETIPQAHLQQESGHTVGKIVIEF